MLASDIPANVSVGLDADRYFPLGNVSALAERLRHTVRDPLTPDSREARRNWVASRYNWDRIAEQTHALYLRTALI